LVPSQDSPGPLTFNVDDAALVFEVLQGADMHDTATLGSHLPASQGGTLQGLRIGVPRRFVADTILNEDREPAFEDVLRMLAEAGAVIVDPCDLPSAEQLADVRSCVFRTEFKASLDAMLQALAPCGMSSMADIISWNREHPEAIPYGQALLEAANASTGVLSQQYIDDRRRDIALSLHAGIRSALIAGRADVLLSPMTAAAKCTGKAGAPVVAIPVGADRAGNPFGVTVLAQPGQDFALLRAALEIEQVIGRRIDPNLD
jgi:amidase